MLESTAEGCTVYPLQSRLRAYAHGFIQYMAIRRLSGPKTEEFFEKLRDFSFRVDGKPYGFSMGKLFQRKEISNSISSSSHDSSASSASFSSSIKPSPPPPPPPLTTPTNDNTTSSPTNELGRTFSRGAWNEPHSDSNSQSLPANPYIETLSSKKSSSSWKAKLTTLTPKELDLEKKKTFFCSELVAAAQQEAGFIKPNFNVSAFWPGSFSTGGDVDEAVEAAFEYGPEILIDCREMEVGRAYEVSPNSRSAR
mmetsp:Transcript_21156/g.27514  ORF Transcript_21156/g.27514 Transcript_21156/m.27514 type:complete len:253 (+) Transcript_21156:152-910(+)